MTAWCGFEWLDYGDQAHTCGQRGPHERHRCANDNCEASVAVSVGGGKQRGKVSAGRPR